MADSAQQTAFVTGAAQGIGSAIAESMFASGRNVVLVDRDGDGVRAAAARLDPSGERTHAIALDLRDAPGTAAAFEEAAAVWGGVDVLVNNAAILGNTNLWELTIDEWDDVLDTNLRAVFILSRAAGEHMRERGCGRIINLASLAGQTARPSGTAYAASKAGVVALTRSFALELSPQGVTVNAIAPGMTDTPMVRGVSDETRERLLAGVPVGRLVDPAELAALVQFLASAEAASITGATYDINGGALMR
ncbi:MAG: SDR family oxidoreductase [Actinobacteria bacterium]|nr:SDR family oxidoreductase [Actinomycetota bacterium]